MFNTVNDIKQLAADTGNHFFDRDAMRFFKSRIGHKVYGGRFFVSSEQFDDGSPRLYTVRVATYEGGRLDVDTVGGFQQYETRADAVAAIRQIAEG